MEGEEERAAERVRSWVFDATDEVCEEEQERSRPVCWNLGSEMGRSGRSEDFEDEGEKLGSELQTRARTTRTVRVRARSWA